VTEWFVKGKRNIIVPRARHHNMAGLLRGAALTREKALPSVNATLNTQKWLNTQNNLPS
jgi:hypothetical protein